MTQRKPIPKKVKCTMRRTRVPSIFYTPAVNSPVRKIDSARTKKSLRTLCEYYKKIGTINAQRYWKDVLYILKYFEKSYQKGDIQIWFKLYNEQRKLAREYYTPTKKKPIPRKHAKTSTRIWAGNRARVPRKTSSNGAWRNFIIHHPWEKYRKHIPDELRSFFAHANFLATQYRTAYWDELKLNGSVRLIKHITGKESLDIFQNKLG